MSGKDLLFGVALLGLALPLFYLGGRVVALQMEVDELRERVEPGPAVEPVAEDGVLGDPGAPGLPAEQAGPEFAASEGVGSLTAALASEQGQDLIAQAVEEEQQRQMDVKLQAALESREEIVRGAVDELDEVHRLSPQIRQALLTSLIQESENLYQIKDEVMSGELSDEEARAEAVELQKAGHAERESLLGTELHQELLTNLDSVSK